jgi:hypothetical protein
MKEALALVSRLAELFSFCVRTGLKIEVASGLPVVYGLPYTWARLQISSEGKTMLRQ